MIHIVTSGFQNTEHSGLEYVHYTLTSPSVLVPHAGNGYEEGGCSTMMREAHGR